MARINDREQASLTRTTLNNTGLRKSIGATSQPTSGEYDSAAGYEVGSEVWDSTNNQVFKAVEVEASSSRWVAIAGRREIYTDSTTITLSDSDFVGDVYYYLQAGSAITVNAPATTVNKEPCFFKHDGVGQPSFAADSTGEISAKENKLAIRTQNAWAALLPKMDSDGVFSLIGDLDS